MRKGQMGRHAFRSSDIHDKLMVYPGSVSNHSKGTLFLCYILKICQGIRLQSSSLDQAMIASHTLSNHLFLFLFHLLLLHHILFSPHFILFSLKLFSIFPRTLYCDFSLSFFKYISATLLLLCLQ